MSLPADSYYSQDAIRPSRICHGFDYGDPHDDGSLGYIYNFIDYFFEEDGVKLWARHYLDQPGEVSVNIMELEELNCGFARKILVFLAMRYKDIHYPADEGVGLLPEALRERVTAEVQAHMARHTTR